MVKRKLLLVAGAGASIEFGMPSVTGVDDILDKLSIKWFPLASNPDLNLYGYMKEGLDNYFQSRSVHLCSNFEDILYAAYLLSSDGPYITSVTPIGNLPEVIFFGSERRRPTKNDLRTFGRMSVDAILDGFRECCRLIEANKTSEFTRLKNFIEAMQAEFDISVVTLNYDNLIYRSLQGIETGFDQSTGQFVQDRLFSRTQWPCILHLHGSVHFEMRGQGNDLHEIFWQPDLTKPLTQNSFGRGESSNVEGINFPTSTIIAGYGKPIQMLRRPFRTYYSELDRLVSDCDAILIAGYGFGDNHLNIAFERFRDARCRPVVVIGWADDNAMTVSGHGWTDIDSCDNRLFGSFATAHDSMRWLGKSRPSTVKLIKEDREFEYSENNKTPLSLWYNGMLSACDHPDKILSRLR
jgi:SIR2-like domain